MSYWMYLIIIIILTVVPQIMVNSTYSKYSKIRVNSEKTGETVVEDMLMSSGVMGVNINRINGTLTDHYDPKRKSINLSNANFGNASIASIAVAAHETGHAIQDNKGYFFLRLRHSLAPVNIVASKLSWIVIYLGFLLFNPQLIWLGIILIGVIVLFDFVTLPVEINASKRAREYLTTCGSFTKEEINGASKVLTAAAFTYVAATLAGVLQLIRLIGLVNDD